MEQKIEQRHPELYNHMEKKQKHIIPIIPLHGGGGVCSKGPVSNFLDGVDWMGGMGWMRWERWDGWHGRDGMARVNRMG